MRLDVGDVGHSNMVRHIDFELTVQRVISDDRWLAAISTRATFVANLCCDASQAGQMNRAGFAGGSNS